MMKNEIPKGAVIAIIAAVAILALGGAYMMSGGGGASKDQQTLEDLQGKAAREQYSGYQASTGGTGGVADPNAAPSGPPQSGEGAAQAANPSGKPGG